MILFLLCIHFAKYQFIALKVRSFFKTFFNGKNSFKIHRTLRHFVIKALRHLPPIAVAV
jgi:hypothetical protein